MKGVTQMKKKSVGRVEGFANKVRQIPAISKFRNAAREWIFYQFMHQLTLGNGFPETLYPIFSEKNVNIQRLNAMTTALKNRAANRNKLHNAFNNVKTMNRYVRPTQSLFQSYIFEFLRRLASVQ